MEDFIQIKEENVIRVKVKDKDNKDTGVVITFDLQDVSLPLKFNKMEALHRKNLSILRQKGVALDKQEDKKGKFLLSWKAEKKSEILEEHYKKEMEALDLLIGEGTTQKILNALGRNCYYNMFDDIVDSLTPILDKMENEADKLIKKVEEKYGVDSNELVI